MKGDHFYQILLQQLVWIASSHKALLAKTICAVKYQALKLRSELGIKQARQESAG